MWHCHGTGGTALLCDWSQHPGHWQGSEGLSPPWDTPHLLIHGSPFLLQIFKGDI